MSARVLVVDDVLPNVKLLEAKLTREYFEVLTAMNGPDALALMAEAEPDIVLLDVMMPGMDGFEVCSRIKADPKLAHIPVVMVTALSDVKDRVNGLNAGADDFLNKPVEDVQLFARVRSLVRLKMMTDELRLREETSNAFGISADNDEDVDSKGGQILVVEDRDVYARNICTMLENDHQVTISPGSDETMLLARNGSFEMIVVSLNLQNVDGLRLCAQLRTAEVTRQLPLLVLVEDSPEDMKRLVKGLDLGVNDYLIRPIDRNELLARTKTQLRRKRYQDRLRFAYHNSIALAVTDSLTGLYNRRYMESHLGTIITRAEREQKPLSLLIMDIDHFKTINDTYGHVVGDEVLTEFARRITRSIRGIDMAARFGGEEFVVAMPETHLVDAINTGERLREAIAEKPFQVNHEVGEIAVTVSIGVSERTPGNPTGSELIQVADKALYAAKDGGRNRVCASDAEPENPLANAG